MIFNLNIYIRFYCSYKLNDEKKGIDWNENKLNSTRIYVNEYKMRLKKNPNLN